MFEFLNDNVISLYWKWRRWDLCKWIARAYLDLRYFDRFEHCLFFRFERVSTYLNTLYDSHILNWMYKL